MAEFPAQLRRLYRPWNDELWPNSQSDSRPCNDLGRIDCGRIHGQLVDFTPTLRQQIMPDSLRFPIDDHRKHNRHMPDPRNKLNATKKGTTHSFKRLECCTQGTRGNT